MIGPAGWLRRRTRRHRVLEAAAGRPAHQSTTLAERIARTYDAVVADAPTWWRHAVYHRRRRLLAAASVGGGTLGWCLGGPVAAVVLAAYGGLAGRAVVRRHFGQQRQRRREQRIDALAAMAADLRAGLPVRPADLSPARSAGRVRGTGRGTDDRLAALTAAATRLAEQTGAPLADLLERIEADARSTDRSRDAAMAQAAGATATAWLLAGLPAGGIALGYGIGVDPLAVLLHTPIGGACAVIALGLQLAGLAWTERLSHIGEV
ncbi:hypothetical protein O7632_04580 [Solwaraspora sp. WMMD406]|uniref:hypothetical protein n=1 Tax=Solwaraspora sp. WMMD406 TaxID=3016095 RepID=UPI0024177A7E|nr:hypothetical protein [Solwaraspora sp. WMMD406]MDG4763387.1 hypothetical protein [Solwaraspora sp. WMMD406]